MTIKTNICIVTDATKFISISRKGLIKLCLQNFKRRNRKEGNSNTKKKCLGLSLNTSATLIKFGEQIYLLKFLIKHRPYIPLCIIFLYNTYVLRSVLKFKVYLESKCIAKLKCMDSSIHLNSTTACSRFQSNSIIYHVSNDECLYKH